MSALGPSLASSVKSSRGLYSFLKPLADKYAQLAGYRQHGLKYDDILIEENDVVQKVCTDSLLYISLVRVHQVDEEEVRQEIKMGKSFFDISRHAERYD